MEIVRFADAAAFLERARGFLLQREACHNLILGLAAVLTEQLERYGNPPWLAAVEEDGAVVLAVLRTPPFNPILSMTGRPDAVRLVADALLAESPSLPGVSGPEAEARTFADLWREHTGRAYRLDASQRIYQLDRVSPVRGVPGELRRATERDRVLLIDWVRAFNAEAESLPVPAETTVDARLASASGGLYLWWDGGSPVSLAGYTGPTPNGIRIGPVYTPPEHRRRGYASACVAALSQLLLDGGRTFCFLFTDLDNATANHVYQSIGYRHVCDFHAYAFEAEG